MPCYAMLCKYARCKRCPRSARIIHHLASKLEFKPAVKLPRPFHLHCPFLRVKRPRRTRLLLPKNHHPRHSDRLALRAGIPKRSACSELAALERKLNLADLGLLNALALVKVQAALRRAISARRNEDVKVLSAQGLCGVCRAGAQRDDGAAADVHGDVACGEIGFCDVGACGLDFLEGPEVVEDVSGEVVRYGVGVVGCDGRDEQGGAVEPLLLDGEGVGIV